MESDKEQNENLYIIGEVRYLQSVFPGVDVARYSLDKSRGLIVRPGGELIERLKNDAQVKVLTHSEAREHLRTSDWAGEITDVPKFKRKRIE